MSAPRKLEDKETALSLSQENLRPERVSMQGRHWLCKNIFVESDFFGCVRMQILYSSFASLFHNPARTDFAQGGRE